MVVPALGFSWISFFMVYKTEKEQNELRHPWNISRKSMYEWVEILAMLNLYLQKVCLRQTRECIFYI